MDEGVTGGAAPGRADRVARLEAAILARPGLRAPQLAEATGLPETTVVRGISHLRGEGGIVFLGAPRTGGYFPKAPAAKEKWGERATAVRACRRVVRSIVRWGALRDTDRHGVYARRSVPISATPEGVQLLVEGLLRGTGADAGPLEGLTSSPALFPFHVPLADSWGSGSGRLELTREGVDRDVVVLVPHPRGSGNHAT